MNRPRYPFATTLFAAMLVAFAGVVPGDSTVGPATGARGSLTPIVELSCDGVVVLPTGGGTHLFDTSYVGGPAPTRTFTVRNIGDVNLQLESINLGSGFSVAEDIDHVIPAGGSDTFTIQHSTTAPDAGTTPQSVTIATNASAPINLSVRGTVLSSSAPRVKVRQLFDEIPDGGGVIDFGSTFAKPAAADYDTLLEKKFTVSNEGSATLEISNFAVPPGYEVFDAFGTMEIPPGASRLFVVQLPQTADVGTHAGAIQFDTNDPAVGQFSFSVTGDVLAAPCVDASFVEFRRTSANPGNYEGLGAQIQFTKFDGDCGGSVGGDAPWNNEIKYTITNPSGTSVAFIDADGLSNSPFRPKPLFQFHDDAAIPFPTTGELPDGGAFKPENPFAAFAGQPVAGTWTIRVEDTGASDAMNHLHHRLDFYRSSAAAAVVSAGGTTYSTYNGGDPGPAINFGTVSLNAPAVRKTITVVNTSTDVIHLDIETLGASDAFRYVDGLEHTLEPGGSDTFTLEMATSTPGVFDRTMTIYASNEEGQKGNLILVPISGTVQHGVLNVTSSLSGGIYDATATGTVIDVFLHFTAPVVLQPNNRGTVTITSGLLMETGDTDRYATYLSGSGTDTLTFRYTIESGDVTPDLDYHSANALFLPGSTLADASTGTIPFGMLLPAPGQQGSLSAWADVVIDTVVPDLGFEAFMGIENEFIPPGTKSVKAILTETVTPSFSENDLVLNNCTVYYFGSECLEVPQPAGCQKISQIYLVPVAPGPFGVTVPAHSIADAAGNTNPEARSISLLQGDDAYEPNDTPEQAKAGPPLPTNTLVEDLALSGQDWYRIPIAPGESIRVAVFFDHSEGDVNAQLIDTRLLLNGVGLVLSGGYSTSNEEILQYIDRTAAPEVYLRVYQEGAVGNPDYSVYVQTFGYDDAFEPNSGPAIPASITNGQQYDNMILKDDDFYRVTTTGLASIDVQVDHDFNVGQIYFQILEDNGTFTVINGGASAYYTPNQSTMVLNNINVAGRTSVVLRVFGANSGANFYDMRVTPGP